MFRRLLASSLVPARLGQVYQPSGRARLAGWVVACFGLALAAKSARADSFVYDRIVAVVGSKVVLQSDLEYELRSSPIYFEAVSALGANPSPAKVEAKREELRSVILDQLIGDFLVLAEAERIPNATVTQEELDQQLAMLAQNNKLASVEELRKIVEKAGDFGTWDRYTKSLRRQIGVAKMEQAAPHSAPTQAQVRARYREMAKGEEAKVEVLRWFFPQQVGGETTAKVTAQSVALARKNGEEFPAIALRLKLDAQVRVLAQGQSAPAIDGALFAAKPGDVIGPLPATGGHLVFAVMSLKASQILPFEQAQEQIGRQLDYEARTRELKAYRERLRLKAHVEVRE